MSSSLVLHGAMVTDQEEDPEGELLARIRRLDGAEALPIFGLFDLHANFTQRMASLSDGLVAYRENPHTDAFESAVWAADLLARCLAEGGAAAHVRGPCASGLATHRHGHCRPADARPRAAGARHRSGRA